MADSVEILFKFVNQGSAELDKAAESAKKVESAALKAGDATDKLGKLLEQAGGAGKQFEGLGDKIRRGLSDPLSLAGGSAAGLATGMGVSVLAIDKLAERAVQFSATLFKLVADQAAAAEATLNMADRLGLTAGQMELLQAQAKVAGVNIGSLEGAARTLSLALEDSGGAGKKAAAGLEGLRVSTRDAKGELRGIGPIFLDVMKELSKIEVDSERTFKALQVLPRGAALEVLPLIKQYKDLGFELRELGFGVEDGLTQNLAKVDDSLDKVYLSWDRLVRAMAGGVVGNVAINATDMATKLLSGNFDGIKVPGARAFGLGKPELDAMGERERDRTMLDIPAVLRGRDSSGAMAQMLMDVDRQFRKDEAEKFKKLLSLTTDGRKSRISELDKEITKLNGDLSADIPTSARLDKTAERSKALSERASIEASLKPSNAAALAASLSAAIDGYLKAGVSEFKRFELELESKLTGLRKQGASPADLQKVEAAAEPERQRLLSGELRKFEARYTSRRALASLPVFDPIAASVEFANRASATSSLESSSAKFQEQLDAFLVAEKKRQEITDQRVKIELDAAVRLLELGDNEYKNAKAVRDLKLATAKGVIESRQAELDYTVRIADLDKRRVQSAKDTAGKVFDSLNSREGGFGLGDFLKGQKDILLRQVFVNGSAGIFEKFGGLGGQIGKSLGPLGKLFEGTLLDPQNVDSATDKNTSATDRNTSASERLTAAMLSGVGGLGIPGAGTAGLLDSLLASDGNGIAGQGGGGLSGMLAKIPGLNKTSSVTNFFDGLFGQKNGKGLGTAVGLGAGAFQVVQGARSGDIGGIISGGITTASAIPGPQQPFFQAAALLAPFITSLFGKGRKDFEKEQVDLLNARRFEAPTPNSFRGLNLFGGEDTSTDFDYRGRQRIVVQRNIYVKIDALDSRSIEERGFDISQAVARQVDAGMPISDSINRAIFGAGVA